MNFLDFYAKAGWLFAPFETVPHRLHRIKLEGSLGGQLSLLKGSSLVPTDKAAPLPGEIEGRHVALSNGRFWLVTKLSLAICLSRTPCSPLQAASC